MNIPTSSPRPTTPNRSAPIASGFPTDGLHTNVPALDQALRKLEDRDFSAQDRFRAWNDALLQSLHLEEGVEREACLSALGDVHPERFGPGHGFDPCVELRDLDIDRFEEAFDLLEKSRSPLPVSVVLWNQTHCETDPATIQNRIDSPSMSRFGDLIFRNSRTLRSLKLVDIAEVISADFIDRLALALKGNQSLQSLTLCNYSRVPDSMVPVMTALGANRSIKELNLSYNRCGKDELGALTNALASNHNLRKLTINGFAMHDHGQALFEKVKDRVKEISLTLPAVTKGCNALKDLLNDNRSLTSIQLIGWNTEPAPRREKLKVAVRSNPVKTLKELRHARKADQQQKKALKPKEIKLQREKKAIDCIIESIPNCSTLKRLSLRDCRLDADQLERLGSQLDAREMTCQLTLGPGHLLPAQGVLEQALGHRKKLVELSVLDAEDNKLSEEILIKRHEKTTTALRTMIADSPLHLWPLPQDVLNLIFDKLDPHTCFNVIEASLPNDEDTRGPLLIDPAEDLPEQRAQPRTEV